MQNGITLIALIITIIVMLILVGVTINVAINGGLIGNANEAARKMEEKTIYDQIVGAMQLKNEGKIDVKGTYEAAKATLQTQGNTVTPASPATEAEITDATASITFGVKGKKGTYTYTITKEEIIIGIRGKIINDFEIEVSQNVNGSPVSSVTLNIRPIIPDSWTPEFSEQTAVDYVANANGVEATTLSELDIDVYNILVNMGAELPSFEKSPLTYSDFDTLKSGLGIDIENEEEAAREVFKKLMQFADAPFATVEDMAADEYEYEAETKKLKINGEEVTEGTEWNGHEATYTVTKNGTYEIQLELDGKISTKIVEIAEIVKYVKYDSNGDGSLEDEILYIVLYDEGELGEGQGAQIITADTLEVDNVFFGINDSTIVESEVEDFDGIEGLSELEKSVYSYNNAIKTLNSKCESLVKTKQGITKGVRSAGSNPTSPDSENTTPYTSENLAKWPESAAGIANGKGYSTDENYVSDYNKMERLRILAAENAERYWLASRLVEEVENEYVGLRLCFMNPYGVVDRFDIFRVQYDCAIGSDNNLGVRPVVVLQPGVLEKAIDDSSGSGTETDPFILQPIS